MTLQASIFKYEDLNLLNAFDIYEQQIKQTNLDTHLINAALDSLKRIPKKTRLCHFDFHPLNIMYVQNDYVILDWLNAKLGNPVMDIASTYIIFRQYLNRQANLYLNKILKLTQLKKDDVLNAIPLMACIKLRENSEKVLDTLLESLVLKKDVIFK